MPFSKCKGIYQDHLKIILFIFIWVIELTGKSAHAIFQFMKWFEAESAICAEIERLLAARGRIVIAMDGNAAAGKSTFAAHIAEKAAFQCSVNVFHMDDFFLPPALRTPERLREPGGNVHYERFESEVLAGIASGTPFSYGVFDCSKMAITQQVAITPAALSIVEGAYNMHPRFGTPYDLRIFLCATPQTQQARILARNGETMLKRFLSTWIPMENAYFQAFSIQEQCDFVLHAEEMPAI